MLPKGALDFPWSAFMWNAAEHTDDENLRWTWLRSIEWCSWPVFVSQPFVPVLLLLLAWPLVVLSVLAANIVWASTVRYRYVNISAAYWGVIIVKAKWATCCLSAWYLWTHDLKVSAGVAVLWPGIATVLAAIPPSNYGTMQKVFLNRLGYASAPGG